MLREGPCDFEGGRGSAGRAEVEAQVTLDDEISAMHCSVTGGTESGAVCWAEDGGRVRAKLTRSLDNHGHG